MKIREATPSDVDSIRSIVTTNVDAERLIRDRRVIVAERDSGIAGVASYDVSDGAVHLSVLAGESDVLDALLEEPRRFAASEELPIEIVIPRGESGLETVLEGAGFERIGTGPTFEGDRSVRYRYVD